MISKPLLKARLSDKQWDNVKFINTALHQEYHCRREMLLKRLDVTIQSFKWSDKAKVSLGLVGDDMYYIFIVQDEACVKQSNSHLTLHRIGQKNIVPVKNNH